MAPYKLSLEDAKVNFSDTDQVIFQQLFTEPGRMVQRHTDRPQILQEHIITTTEPDTVTLARVVRDQNRQTKMNYPQFQLSQHKDGEVRLSAYQGAAS